MSNFLLLLVLGMCVSIIIWGLMRPERAIQFPFLGVVGFSAYVLPQLYGSSQLPMVPASALEKTLLMSIFCLVAAYFGYVNNKRPALLFGQWLYNYRKLQLASIWLTTVGVYFFYKMNLLAPEVSLAYGGAWTGPITIYAFLSGLLTLGFILALNLHLRRPSFVTLVVMLIGVALYLDRIVIHGRRRALIELGIIVLMALWFHRRWVPPRWAIIAAVVVGTLVINAIAQYRGLMLEEDRSTWTGAGVAEISEIDFVGNLMDTLKGRKAGYDGLNAIYYIDATDRELNFDYGLSLYNKFINEYIPGQIIGKDVKRALKIEFGNSYGDLGHVFHAGTTNTGIGDAFKSFWYFGFVKFLLIGYLMSRWFRAAERGVLAAQVIVSAIAYYGIAAFGFSTDAFFIRFVFLGIFLLPVLMYARVRINAPAA